MIECITLSDDGYESWKDAMSQYGFPSGSWQAARDYVSGENLTIALVNSAPAGVFSWDKRIDSDDQVIRICTRGTWVRPFFRRMGVGRAMWDHAINETKAKKISCGTVTWNGALFADAQKYRLGGRVEVMHHLDSFESREAIKSLSIRSRKSA